MKVVANLPYAEYFDRLVKGRHVAQGIAAASGGKLPAELALVHQVAVDVTGTLRITAIICALRLTARACGQ